MSTTVVTGAAGASIARKPPLLIVLFSVVAEMTRLFTPLPGMAQAPAGTMARRVLAAKVPPSCPSAEEYGRVSNNRHGDSGVYRRSLSGSPSAFLPSRLPRAERVASARSDFSCPSSTSSTPTKVPTSDTASSRSARRPDSLSLKFSRCGAASSPCHCVIKRDTISPRFMSTDSRGSARSFALIAESSMDGSVAVTVGLALSVVAASAIGMQNSATAIAEAALRT